ncbi:citrate/2-methylcitrate synthase [Candidatus Epulonipiscium viviparus]|uniref:citrate/2-methylcitrate synthase n=1 Tax=Candidatus Epulonipiscium viviparus TaxID=420336 RepID=UPI0027381676|nr:citrate/2-methylcitrate synthase [Candidatus Epulopiscium viviparus]
MENTDLTVLSKHIAAANRIDQDLFDKYEVRRGLRRPDGTGVLVGLTHIGNVHSYIIDEGEIVPVPGLLTYRGIDMKTLCSNAVNTNRMGFEETAFLLLFGHLPTEEELANYNVLLGERRILDHNFIKSYILDNPSPSIMNAMARSVLALYTFDDDAEDNSIENVLRQSLELIAAFPTMMVYAYQAYNHYYKQKSLFIHSPNPKLSTAENILYMLRPDKSFTKLEATLLDLALIIHAEHGGGNNSTFAAHLITSAHTDTYSVIAAALGSLKGIRHGGASIKALEMFECIKESVTNWDNDEEIKAFLRKILNKEAFDKSGLIYGIGHAIYIISDPRAVILKTYAEKLAIEKGCEDQFQLLAKIEELAPVVLTESKDSFTKPCANVDFYSGFVYGMLNIPKELFLPLFAVSRIVGWSAHRLEEIVNTGKIIRPAYKNVERRHDYIPINER